MSTRRNSVTEDKPDPQRTRRLTVVIPTKNEARNIGWVLQRMPGGVDEIILVDGNSTDDTVEVARRIRPDIRVLAEQEAGKGAALRTGFAAATGDFIVMIDADGSMDPQEIPRCLEVLEDRRTARGQYEVVKGSRFAPGGGSADITVIRRLGNRLLLVLTNRLYGARFTDLCYGFFGFRRDKLHALGLRAKGFEIETEIVVRALRTGVRIGEIPSFEKQRHYGESNLNTYRDGAVVLATLLRERFARRNGSAHINGSANGNGNGNGSAHINGSGNGNGSAHINGSANGNGFAHINGSANGTGFARRNGSNGSNGSVSTNGTDDADVRAAAP
jgi:glycosyltransferase involved in cell wall biosynthesis